MVDCRPHCKSKPKFHPYRVAHYLRNRFTCEPGSEIANVGKLDIGDELALMLLQRVMPGAFRRARRGRVGKVDVWDRWANGNQYGSYNSDDD